MVDEWPKKVRTTMQPHREIEVGQAEYLDLSRQGLLRTEPAKKAPVTQKEN